MIQNVARSLENWCPGRFPCQHWSVNKRPPATAGIPPPRLMAAARVLAGLSQNSLAEAAGINRTNLARFELGTSLMRSDTLAKVIAALEARGIRFIPQTDGLEMGVALVRKQAE